MTREMCCGLYLQKLELQLFDVIVSNVNKMNTCENSMSDSFMDEHAAKRIKLEIAER